MDYKSVRIEKDQNVAEVILLGPGKGNAMGPDFWRELPVVFEELDAAEDVRAIIVRGQGENFSYGLDLTAMIEDLGPHFVGAQNLTAERTELFDLIKKMQRAFDGVENCRKPVIAAVSGWCIGGGLDLIAACDVRFCSADAHFSLREVKIAIVADLGSIQRLPRIIGEGHTRELAFTGKDIDAKTARQIGLVNEVAESSTSLHELARTTAKSIASNPPLVVQGIKRVMNYCSDKSVRDGLDYVAVWNAAFLQSNDLAEALNAFRERRPSTFKGC